MSGNSSLELHSADLANFGCSQTISLALRPKFAKNYESQTENPSVVLNNKNGESTNQAQNYNISSLRESRSDSWQSTIKISRTKCNRISPDSWCKKSESKGAVVPPADFLLESELRGTPPKSEKAAAFWRVGGAGRGVQPFLLEKTSESKKQHSDSIANNANTNIL